MACFFFMQIRRLKLLRDLRFNVAQIRPRDKAKSSALIHVG